MGFVGESSLEASANRFRGFADLYDGVRPVPPTELGDLIVAYRGHRPQLVVDLGSGTGLSSRWASGWAAEVVGIEPSDDMRAAANAPADNVRLSPGWSHDTGLPTGCADVVLAVQALHWMEPAPTFAEVERLLCPGGVFAAVDCDWPPVVGDAVIEEAWDSCRRRIRVFETRLASGMASDELRAPVNKDDNEGWNGDRVVSPHRRGLPEGVRRWSKAEHLERMKASDSFQWCREIAMAHTEPGDANRFVGLLRSQGDYQALQRHGLSDAVLGVDDFAETVERRLGDQRRQLTFIYRARLGFKSLQ